MIFRILAVPVWPGRRVLALLVGTALSATLLSPGVQAQQPAPAPAQAPAAAPKAKAATPAAPRAAPKAAPAAPSAQQAPPAAVAAAGGQAPDQQVQLIYAPWTKFCLSACGANVIQG